MGSRGDAHGTPELRAMSTAAPDHRDTRGSTTPSPLLAILLVTSSSRGSQVAFRWPRKPRVLKRHSKVRYYTAEEQSRPAAAAAAASAPGASRPLSAHRQQTCSTVQDRAVAVRGVEPAKQSSRGSILDRLGLEKQEAGSLTGDDEFHPPQHLSEFWSDDQGSITSPSESSISSSSDEVDTYSIDGGNHGTGMRGGQSSRSLTGLRRHSRSSTGQSFSRPRKRDIDDLRESDANGSDAGLAPSSHANTAEEDGGDDAKERNIRAHKTYLGYECDFLASLLSPKQDLCHQKFEMVIDDLAFLGHPVSVADEFDDELDQRGRQGGRSREDEPIRRPEGSPRTKLDLFHFVLVLDRPDPSSSMPALDLTGYLQFFYDNVVFKLTAALYAEQMRCQYVALEAEKLILLRERCMDDGECLSALPYHAPLMNSRQAKL